MLQLEVLHCDPQMFEFWSAYSRMFAAAVSRIREANPQVTNIGMDSGPTVTVNSHIGIRGTTFVAESYNPDDLQGYALTGMSNNSNEHALMEYRG
jgi:hypothetical protein